MSEFIGSRISLISKSDIRYVGTLHEINSENSTVALEQVSSFGTEGRRNNPEDEIAGSDSVYEYIVFRGSDVKDLRIEEPPKENKPPPPQVPNDPAILGTGSRPPASNVPPHHLQAPTNGPRGPLPPHFQQPPPFQPYQPYNQYQQQLRFPGPQGNAQPGFPGAPGPPNGFQGYPGMPYGAPHPGWYPPPGQGFPHPPGPFAPPPQQLPFAASGPQGFPNMQQQRPPQKPGPPGAAPNLMPEPKAVLQRPAVVEQPPTGPRADKTKSQSTTPAPVAPTSQGPAPPLESKPDVATALAPPSMAAVSRAMAPTSAPTTTAKSSKIIPAVPLASPPVKPTTKQTTPLQASTGNAVQNNAAKPGQAAANAALQYQNATQAATAAVAAAMAKLPPAPSQKPRQAVNGDAIDNLATKVNEMRTEDKIRNSRQTGTGGYAGGNRGGRGGGRRGGREQSKGLDVPTTDFDFESANAKFNKHDLVKEAIASGETSMNGETPSINGTEASTEPTANGTADTVIPGAAMYNKSSSFFDNISSEARDRDEAADGKRRPSGPEFRTEERKRNLETFGMGSVEGGHRGGFRGRGRGRGGFREGRGAGGFGGHGRGGGGVDGASGVRGRGRATGAVRAQAEIDT